MITEHNCAGCSACLNICPKSSISMQVDEEGFFYPTIDSNSCINCGLCKKYCPLNKQVHKPIIPSNVIGCRASKSEDLYKGSSGGMFGIIASKFIDRGGLVAAAMFNDNNKVVHNICTKTDELTPFLKSKYVQSDLGGIFKRIKDELKNGKSVLFVGTPCQVAGLLSFIEDKYKNSLFCIDFVCHGVPSPGVWAEYINEIGGNLSDIDFRDKKSGWPSYSFSYQREGKRISHLASTEPYMRGFLHNLYLRPSCHSCKFKGFVSGADITLSDFWGVWKNKSNWNDQKGASVMSINTHKGNEILASLDKNKYECASITAKQAYVDYNNSAYSTAPTSEKRKLFFLRFRKEPLLPLISELSQDPIKVRLKNFLSNIKRKLI